MNIRQTLLASHLLVGLLPLFLVFVILSLVFTVQFDRQVSQNLEKQLSAVRIRYDTLCDTYLTFSYFFKRAPQSYNSSTSDYYFNSYNLSTDMYKIILLEYTISNKAVRRYISRPDTAAFSSDDASLDAMWKFLSAPQYNLQFCMQFNDILSNNSSSNCGLVLRFASIIYDIPKSEKLGLAVVSQPLDPVFLQKLAGDAPELTVFVDTGNSVVFSKEEMNTRQFRESFRKQKPELSHQKVLSAGLRGKYYCYQEMLYRPKKQAAVTIGILYGFNSINRTLLLLQSVGYTVFAISLLIAVLISLYLASRMTKPILKLRDSVVGFQGGESLAPKPTAIRNEIDQLQKSFDDMSSYLVRYKKDIDHYNDQLTQEVEKKTRELMIQIRGLLLVNDLSVFLGGREYSEEREFLGQLSGFLKETYRLRYLSAYDVRGPGTGRQMKECFETPAADRNVAGRLESLETLFIRRIRIHPGRIIRWNGSVVVCAFPIVVGNVSDYVIFLVANSRSLQLLFDTVDTVSNMVAMKIDSLRITSLKIESEKLASIGQFASTVVHDIKNPLTVIKSFVEALHDPDFSEEEKQGYYQTLRKEIELLTNMLNDILDFSRGQLNLTKEAVDIDRLIADIARFYAKTFHDRKLILHCTTDCGIVAEIDRNRVWRSVGNLVQNAIDVLPQGGEIRIDAVRDGEWLMLSVRDNGPGIPQEVRESLFQPFFTFGKKGGTGLGLSIVKKITESHGGVLRYETKIDGGTVFTMRLPIRVS